MPDLYTPVNVSTGIDTNTDFLLKLDTAQRFDNVFSGMKALIEYKIPTFDSSQYGDKGFTLPEILNPALSGDALKKGLTSDDPKTQALAWDSYNKSFQNKGITRGVGSQDVIKAEDWQNKFKNDTFGFNPNLSQQENEAYYYNNDYLNKSLAGKIAANTGKFIGRTLAGAAFKLGESVGYVGAMVKGGVEQLSDISGGWIDDKKDHSFLATVADNALSRYLEQSETNTNDSKLLSVYAPDDFSKKGFFEKLTYGNYWSSSVADGAAFLASAMIPGAVLGKLGSGVSLLGKLGEGANTAVKLRNGIQTVLGLEHLGDAASVIYNTVSESAFEGAGVFKNVTNSLKEARNKGENHLTDDEIRKQAGDRAAIDFRANLGILSISSLFENKFMFKPLANKIAGLAPSFVEQGLKDVAGAVAMDEGGAIAKKEAAKGLFNKFVGRLQDGSINHLARLPYYGKEAFTAIAMEGFWEENAQLAIERVASHSIYQDDKGNDIKAEDGFWKQYFKQTKDAVLGRDPENSESIGLGGVLGVFGATGMTKVLGGVNQETGKIQWGKGARQSEIEALGKQVDKYNNARHNFLSTQDIYKKNEKGEVELDGNNKPVIDEDKVKNKLAALTDYGYRQIKAEDIHNPIFRTKLQQDLFAEYMAAAINAGLDQRLLNKLNALPSKSAEDIKALGFDSTELKTDIPALVASAAKLVQNYKDIYGNSSTPQGKMKVEDYNNKEELRKYNAYLASARAISSDNAHFEFTKQILAKEQLLRPSVFAPTLIDYDPSVQQHNALVFEEQALIATKNDFKGLDYTLLNDHINPRLASIKLEKEKLRKQIAENPETEKGVVEADGFLVNKKKYTRFDIKEQQVVEDHDSFKDDHYDNFKRAELQVDKDLNNTLQLKLRDGKKGLDNYDAYRDYLAKRQLLDREADAQKANVTEEVAKKEEDISNLKQNENPLTADPLVNSLLNAQSEALKNAKLEAEKKVSEEKGTSEESTNEEKPSKIETPTQTHDATSILNAVIKISPENMRPVYDESVAKTEQEIIDNINKIGC